MLGQHSAIGNGLAQHAVGDDDDVRHFAAFQPVGDRVVAGADGRGDGDNGFAGQAFKLRDQ